MTDLFAPEGDPEFDEPAPEMTWDEQKKSRGRAAIAEIRHQLRAERAKTEEKS